MLRKPAIALLSVFALAGCPTRSKQLVTDGGDHPDTDGHTSTDGQADINGNHTLPTLQIVSPTADAYTNGSLTVTVKTGDSSVVTMVSVYVDDGTVPLAAPSSTPVNIAWDTTELIEGLHTLIAKATVGGQAVMSSSVTVHVDRTPPTFTTAPAANNLNVSLSDPITVTFSEPINPTSVTSDSVTLTSGGSPIATSAILGLDVQTITVTMSNRKSLSLPTTITESVSATITDRAGNPVGAKPSWSWSAPFWVKMPALGGTAPSLALDPQGEPVVSLLTETSTTTDLSIVRYSQGATWDLGLGSPTISSGLSVSGACIAVGGDGTPTVAWAQDHVYAAHWNGTNWDSFLNSPDTSVTVQAVSPQLTSMVLDSGAAPIVGWGQSQGLMNSSYVADWSGAAWQLLPAGMPASIGNPTLLINHAGIPLVMFANAFGVSGPTFSIYEAGSWLSIAPPAADARGGVGTLLAFAIDSRDEPATLVELVDSNNREAIQVEALTSGIWTNIGSSLATGIALSTNATAYLALGPDDTPFVLWEQPDGNATARLHLAHYNGTAWDVTYGVLSVMTQAHTDAEYPAIAIDKSGYPTVVWEEIDPSTETPSVYIWKSNY